MPHTHASRPTLSPHPINTLTPKLVPLHQTLHPNRHPTPETHHLHQLPANTSPTSTN